MRIHHSVRNHPKFAAIAADNDLFAVWVKLLIVASERHAGKTGDQVTLNHGDIAWISGRHRADTALRTLSHLADIAGYSLRHQGDITVIHIRNFAKKQGHTPPLRAETPPDSGGIPPAPSPSPSPSPNLKSKTTETPPDGGVPDAYSESLEREDKAAPKGRKKGGGGSETTRLFCSEYERILGVKYGFESGRDGSILARLIRTHGGETVHRLIPEFLELPRDDYLSGSGYSVPAFKARFQGLLLEPGNSRPRLSEAELKRRSDEWMGRTPAK